MKVHEAVKDENTLPLLLQSLIDTIPDVQTFRTKWSLIASKLADIKTHLADLLSDTSPTRTTTASLSEDLLRSLSSTLHDAVSLAKSCQSPTPLNGKLKTQNDIDSLSAKLTRHVTDIDILLKSGVLQDDAAAVSTTTSSKRESVRVSARNLLTRLQIGTAESKNSALDSLLSLLHEDDKNVLIAVAQGAVPVLVRLLDPATSIEIKEKAASAIARVSVVESSKHVLIAEGLLLLQGLIRVLESGSGVARGKVCIVLQVLSQSKENARAIASRGGVVCLLEICRGGTPSSQAAAALVLRNLAGFSEIRGALVEENGVLVLLGLLASGTLQAQQDAIGCLCSLVMEDESLKLLVFKQGGVECLMSYWDSVSEIRSLEVAIELIRSLVLCHLIAEVVVSSGFLERIVSVLTCGVLGVRVAAARAVCDLGFSMKTRKELGEFGCVSHLVRMLEGKGVEEKEASAKALAAVISYAGNRKIFRREGKGIVSVVQLLDPLVKNLDKRYPVNVLLSLVHSKKCRKQMVAAGALVYLPKIVENDVEGAKKLLESLGRGKLLGVFSWP